MQVTCCLFLSTTDVSRHVTEVMWLEYQQDWQLVAMIYGHQ